MKGICYFGDGTVMGLGDDLPHGGQPGWPGRLSAAERAAGQSLMSFNLGVPGDTSGALLCRWRAEAELRAPACDGDLGLVFSFGQEDMVDVAGEGIRVPMLESVLNAEHLMTEARMVWPVLWVGPTPLRSGTPPAMRHGRAHKVSNARVRMLNEAYREIAERLFIPYLDLFALFEEDAAWARALVDGDGVHPAGPGHAQLAGAVGRWPAWREWMDIPTEPLPAAPAHPPEHPIEAGWKPLLH